MIETFAIHTAILVGLLVTWRWTESYGGVFAGYTVPGYLAAIALVAPSSATAIALEGVLTYGVVWLLGDGLAFLGATARVFGRERFLLFVLCSVPVRLLVEGYAQDGLSAMIGPTIPRGEGDGFFSVGLVLVPLLANSFWKVGLWKGVVQAAGTTALTGVLLWAVVMPMFGLEFSSFLLSFENIAADFLSVPKVYIVLLTTAFVATRTAERYGWNAGGLLVPALISLLIFQPTKLVSTLLEIVLLTALYRVVTSIPGIRALQLAGPRRLVLMYVLAWVLKLTLAWTGLWFELSVAAWDLYGFGYLLTSLVAVRCLDLRPIGRVLLPLGINVGAGAGLGLAAATALQLALPQPTPVEPDPDAGRVVRLGEDIVRSAARVVRDPQQPTGDSAMSLALVALVTGSPTLPARVATRSTHRPKRAPCVGLAPVHLGAGTRAWWCGGPGPIALVPAGLSDPDAVWVAAWMAEEGVLSGVVLLGADAGALSDGGAGRARQWARALDAHAMVLVRTHDGPDTELLPRGDAGAPLRLPGTDRAVPFSFGPRPEVDGAFADPLGARHALLRVSVPQVEALLGPPSDPVDPRAPTDDAEVSDDARAGDGWLVHLARHRAGGEVGGFPMGLAWTAGALGLQARPTVDGDWWLADDVDHGFGAWVFRPGARSDWVVIAPLDADEPGTGGAALAVAETLDARAAWLSRQGRRAFGVELGVDPLADPRVAAVRQALRPGPGQEVGHLVVVRRLTPAMPDPPSALLAAATAQLDVPGPDLQVLRDAVAALWPAVALDDHRRVPPASLFANQPQRYLQALVPDHAFTLWLRRDVLGGVAHTEDLRAITRYYALRGVEPVGPDRLQLEFGVDPGAPLDLDPVQRALQAHLEAPTTASLLELGNAGRPYLLTDPPRIGLALVAPDHVCLHQLGSPIEAGWPLAGCWRRR